MGLFYNGPGGKLIHKKPEVENFVTLSLLQNIGNILNIFLYFSFCVVLAPNLTSQVQAEN